MSKPASEINKSITPRVIIPYSAKVGAITAPVLAEAFERVGVEVCAIDYREQMAIDDEVFQALYDADDDGASRESLFAHAKVQARRFLDDQAGDILALPGISKMIDPSIFGKPRLEGDEYDHKRTLMDLALVHEATQRGMPILGVCGGHQALAVYHGATLKRLTQEELEQEGYLKPGLIELDDNSKLAQVLQPDDGDAYPSFGMHVHYVVGIPLLLATEDAKQKPSQALCKVGIAVESGHTECVETKNGVMNFGIQAHPEISEVGITSALFTYHPGEDESQLHRRLFQAMKEAATAYRHKQIVMEQIKSLNQQQEKPKDLDDKSPPPPHQSIPKSEPSYLSTTVRFFTNPLVKCYATHKTSGFINKHKTGKYIKSMQQQPPAEILRDTSAQPLDNEKAIQLLEQKRLKEALHVELLQGVEEEQDVTEEQKLRGCSCRMS